MTWLALSPTPLPQAGGLCGAAPLLPRAGEGGRRSRPDEGQPEYASHSAGNRMRPAGECGFLHCLLGGAERERNSKSRTTVSRSPPQAALRVLEFAFLSRKIASTRSMERRRRPRMRPSQWKSLTLGARIIGPRRVERRQSLQSFEPGCGGRRSSPGRRLCRSNPISSRIPYRRPPFPLDASFPMP